MWKVAYNKGNRHSAGQLTQDGSGSMNIKMCEKEFSGLGFRLLGSIIIVNAMQICGYMTAMAINKEWVENFESMVSWMMIPQYAIGYPLAFLLMHKGGDKRVIGKHRMTFGQFIMAFMMTYAVMMAGNLIGLGVTAGIGFLKGEPVVNGIADLIESGNIWVLSIYTVILAPIFEELLFRKMLCDRVVKYGQGMTVIVSGITFGLAHGNLNQFFYAFFIGCFFAFIYVKTGRVQYTIGLHMLVNFMGSVVAGLLLQNVDLEKPANGDMIVYAVYLLVICAILIAGAVLWLAGLSKFKMEPGEIAIVKGSRFVTVAVNAGMGTFCIVSMLMMVVQALG